MKKIGHVDGSMSDPVWRTHSLGMLAPHDLFIPNPGERENIDAEAFEHVGWVVPDADGGVICGNHATAGDNSRPAYVRRVQIGSRNDEVAAAPISIERGKLDPMDVRRSEFEAHAGALDSLSKAIGSLTDRLRKMESDKIGMSKTYGMLTRSLDAAQSDLFQISTDDLIKEALEFCDTGLGGWDGVEVEAGCHKANVYIRELIGRLHNALRPKPAPTVQAEQPMSFYDHAFIALAVQAISENNGVTKSIEIAHKLASDLTRNRAVPA